MLGCERPGGGSTVPVSKANLTQPKLLVPKIDQCDGHNITAAVVVVTVVAAAIVVIIRGEMCGEKKK